LWDQFSNENKALFEELDGPFGGMAENPLIALIISRLDALLEGTELYEPQRFAHLRLGDEAKQYIGKTLNSDDQIRFNRLLLEAAYPDDIARSGMIEGLAAEIVHFFWDVHSMDQHGNPMPKTLKDFLDECPSYHYEQHQDLGFEIRRFCHNLIAEGLLFSVGFNSEQRMPYNEQFLSYFFSKEMAAYGSYEFVAFGPSKIREHFSKSVVKLIITLGDKQHIGTGFLMEDATMVTAAHCIPEGAHITIEGWDPIKAPLSRIVVFGDYRSKPFVLERSKVDVALFEFESHILPTAPKFRLWSEAVLDDILAMGYPQLSGFQSGLIASKGEVISREMSTARNQPLIIFSASVKGGNSGGPLINRYGKVVGLVTNLGGSDRDVRKLGYGLATPAQSILDLRNLARGRDVNDKQLLPVKFKNSEDAISILK
jgi:serine protease Do